jgi:accessory gene regulator B
LLSAGGGRVTERMANILTERLFLYGLIRNNDKEIYHYLIQVLIEKIVVFFVIFMISVRWEILLETVLFILCFSCIRRYSGGFHANSFGGCCIGTMGIYIVYIKCFYPILLKNMEINMFMLLIAGVLIFTIGAVNHPNMDWNKEEYNVGKMTTRVVVMLEVCSIISLYLLGMKESYVQFMSFGLILSAFLLALGKITKQEVKCK